MIFSMAATYASSSKTVGARRRFRVAKSVVEVETAEVLGFRLASEEAEGAGEGVERWRGEWPGDSNMIVSVRDARRRRRRCRN